MGWSLKLGRVAGIGVFVHWTFFILLAWIAYIHIAAGEDTAMVLTGVGFVIALFACVVLHELGHALTARHYGVSTRDITLLPIGGVARLESIPEQPMQEFWIAVAGPAVNVVIAAILFAILVAGGQSPQVTGVALGDGTFLTNLLWVNIVLVLFNMLPAFPMDGGRVLRALLATQMPRVKATHIASKVGQFMAILMGFAGVMSGNWILLFIAMFVYLGAQAEARAVEIRSILKGHRVRDAMIRQFLTLTAQNTIRDAATESAASHQKDFPVLQAGKIAGIVFYNDLVKALNEGQAEQHVGEIMRRDCLVLDQNDPLDRALDRMNACGCRTLLVRDGAQLVGIISEEHLGQWMMLQSSVRERDSESPPLAA